MVERTSGRVRGKVRRRGLMQRQEADDTKARPRGTQLEGYHCLFTFKCFSGTSFLSCMFFFITTYKDIFFF